jgi:hypothetical protein
VRKLIDEDPRFGPRRQHQRPAYFARKNPLMPLGRLSQLSPLAQLRLFRDSADRVSAARNDSNQSAFFELTNYGNCDIYGFNH